ncbi:N-acetylmuramoyl-L-alanine amidase [Xanthocytophaga agilis]|uniref:N-acetylmuramoyl-L-alanine amidase n=1 Tax=Xanthocytophaga agilis TaxID=3048010 RepID=A0AAE3R5S4_9BACT|nr:N-acetylmuramoyl-L-alanine amidase [Xanthocytophaga agilis]MDJ1501979.1 N-acetylmuramoyl-L-alanine amidase [Xanthocytophaga agilis]
MHFQYLIIHCTATPAGRWVSPEDVKRWHTAPNPYGNGWKQVGYSDLILLDGSRHQFIKHNNDQIIDSFEITNGVTGINSISRHLCYVGGLDKTLKPEDTRTLQQIETMLAIIHEVLTYAPHVKIAGHNQFANKACPSFFVPTWLKQAGIPEHNIEWRGSVPANNHVTQ